MDREKYLQAPGPRSIPAAPCSAHLPPKGQELDDQYFGVIRERVGAFMKDLNEELWKLGIAATTQHNEVGPGPA
ncbi:MAG: hypothetical protein ACLT3D_12255 [Lawsonibacter sp.]